MKITVCIPTKNEADGIVKIITGVKPHADEILVVDGHSRDQTTTLARQAGARVIFDNQKGKGDGLRTGIKYAHGDIIVFIDADGSHDPNDIPLLVDPIKANKADLVIASRAKGGSDEFHMKFNHLIRQWGSEFAAFIVNCRWKVDLTDIQNGFRAIKRDAALALNLNANDFDIEEEMVMKCLHHGYKIAEIASHENRRAWGKSKLPTSKAGLFLWRILKEIF